MAREDFTRFGPPAAHSSCNSLIGPRRSVNFVLAAGSHRGLLVPCQRLILGLCATGSASDLEILALIGQQRRTLAKPVAPQIQAVTKH